MCVADRQADEPLLLRLVAGITLHAGNRFGLDLVRNPQKVNLRLLGLCVVDCAGCYLNVRLNDAFRWHGELNMGGNIGVGRMPGLVPLPESETPRTENPSRSSGMPLPDTRFIGLKPKPVSVSPIGRAGTSGIGSTQSSIRSGGKSLKQLDLPLSDVVASSTLVGPKNGRSDWTMFDGGQVQARYEPEYKLIRTYVGHAQEVVNINLSDDGQRVRSITGYPQVSPDKLQRLVTAGLLRPDLLATVGVSQEQVKIAMERTAHDQQMTLRLQTHSVEKLPSIEKYSGTNHNTKFVGQGEAHFLSSAKADVNGLYTAGATSCVILIAVFKNALGKSENVAMAHVDGYVTDQALDQFFGSLSASGKAEVTLLARNEEESAKRAMKAADKAGATVVFAHAGHESGGGYGAAVDRDGRIYFGSRLSLSKQIATNKTERRIMKGMMSGEKLPIHEQLPAQFHV